MVCSRTLDMPLPLLFIPEHGNPHSLLFVQVSHYNPPRWLTITNITNITTPTSDFEGCDHKLHYVYKIYICSNCALLLMVVIHRASALAEVIIISVHGVSRLNSSPDVSSGLSLYTGGSWDGWSQASGWRAEGTRVGFSELGKLAISLQGFMWNDIGLHSKVKNICR